MMALMLISQCDSEDQINLPPRPFQVSVTFSGKTNATISWPDVVDPEDDSIAYDVYLDNELKTLDLKEHTFSFAQLTMEKLYSGEVVAKDAKGNQTSAAFSFQTTPVRTFTGNITLVTQKDVDQFTSECYTVVNGNLTIGMPTAGDIVDLKNFVCSAGLLGI